VWLVASESATQSVTNVRGAGAVELKELVRDCESHSANHDVEGGNCCGEACGTGRGARGGVNGGPACCTEELY
jgi:hypothetical protein